jgi:hypothetical protein
MLVWYLLCLFAAVTLWRERRHWRALAAPTLTIAGLLLVLALGEGSVGGLFRHRGMVVPFVALLAAPTALRFYEQRVRHGRSSARLDR